MEKEFREAYHEELPTWIGLLITAPEVGESGTPHYQGYVEFKKKVTAAWIKEQPFWMRAHLELSKGSDWKNLAYCAKDTKLGVTGVPMQQGSRTDLENVKDAIDGGAGEPELWQDHFKPMVKYRQAFRDYRLSRVGRNRDAPSVTVIWGPTGTGKTRMVHENEEELWIWGGDRWFDGYWGQEAALFDDFDGTEGFHFRMMLKVLDRYPLQVPVKGGFVAWIPKRIYITSNVNPKDWYVKEKDVSPLLRRFTDVIYKDGSSAPESPPQSPKGEAPDIECFDGSCDDCGEPATIFSRIGHQCEDCYKEIQELKLSGDFDGIVNVKDLFNE